MSKDIWHSALEIPVFDDTVAFIDDLNNWHTGYTQRDNDGITDHDSGEIYTEENVLRWAYIKDLLALETELERTRKTLEQSEICCTEWEKQALDYKAENIALSGDLERTRKALGIAKDTLRWYDDNYDSVVARNTLDEIKTALEQKDAE